MLTPGEASFFWFGVVVSGWNWRRPAYRLLLLWLVIFLLPAVLARGMMPPPSFIRMIGVVPAVYLLVGVGLWEAFRLFAQLGRALPRKASLPFRTHETSLAIAISVVVAVLVLVRGVNTHTAYFHVGAANPRFQDEFNRAWNHIAQTLNALPSKPGTVYLLPYDQEVNFGFEFLYQGDSPAYVFDAGLLDLPSVIRSTLTELGNVTEVRLIRISDDNAHVEHLLNRHGRYVGVNHYPQFAIHTYSDIGLDRPWAFHHNLEPKTIHYDGGISLTGFAVGEGREQLAAQQIISVNDSRLLWVDLQWQTHAELDVDYAVSLRLHNDQGERVYQKDQWLLLGSHYVPTSQWLANEPINTHFLFPVAPHVPVGQYELRLVVYNIETQTPTVVVDVWKPEVALAKIRLADPQN